MVRRRDGYTLVETVVAVGIFGIVAVLVLPFLRLQQDQWHRQEALRNEFRGLVAALDWISRDLRDAGYHCLSSPLHEAGESVLVYELSRDGDEGGRFTLDGRRLVRVYLREERLMYRVRSWDAERGDWNRGGTQILAAAVARAGFRALDSTGATAPDPGSAQSVEILLEGRHGSILRSTIALRNRRGACRS